MLTDTEMVALEARFEQSRMHLFWCRVQRSLTSTGYVLVITDCPAR